MKQALFLSLAATFIVFACAAEVSAQGTHPPRGYVPDAKTAIRIAVAVWSPIYGEKQIQSEKPFHASLKHGVWTVTGSLPSRAMAGGTALVDISKKDGRVLFVMHGK